MTLQEFKETLRQVDELKFILNNGQEMPKHFHITEIGQMNKKFIDCGGTVRNEEKVNLQLWESHDTWHRLKPEKLINIIAIAEDKIHVKNCEIEVEYQGDTIQRFGLEFDGGRFILTATNTACLASDKCGIPDKKAGQYVSESTGKTSDCCGSTTNCC